MKMTLLDMVQSILSSMDSDEVNSYSETPESLQVAYIIRDSFFDVINRANLEEHYRLFELEATGGIAKPTLMTVNEKVDKLLWIKYDNRLLTDTYADYVSVHPMPLKDFIEYTYSFDKTAPEFFSYDHTISTDSITIFGYNNIYPRYYTELEDNTIIFDSYDSTVDAFLAKNKTLCYGLVLPEFTFSNSFVLPIDGNMHQLVFNEAKRQAFIELKQTANPVAEQRAKRTWIHSQSAKENVPTASYYNKYPNYGRK